MRTITLEELLEAGCHFGHQVTRQNPKTRDFVFEARDNIHIIDLEKTKAGLESAAAFIKQTAQNPDSSILVLGTKRQAEGIVKEEAKRANEANANNLYSVTTRWIGGIFTNFGEVTKNFKKLKDISEKLNNEFEKIKFTKKEISLWDKERQKLELFYGGIKDMKKIPDILLIIDTHLEDIGVREARNMGVPIVGIVDTNADPDPINYPIPANDDASGSIKLILSYLVDAWIEGKKKAIKSEEQKGTKETNETKSEKTVEGKEAKVAKVSKAEKKENKETEEKEKKIKKKTAVKKSESKSESTKVVKKTTTKKAK